MDSDLETSREIRNWIKIFQNAQNVNKMQDFTVALNNLRQALSGLNPEMKMFNENLEDHNSLHETSAFPPSTVTFKEPNPLASLRNDEGADLIIAFCIGS